MFALCKKAGRKRSALSRISNYMSFEKKIILKAFVESQFGYCPLTWTFYSRKANSKIKILEITRYTHRRSILGSLAISAGVG